MFKHLKPIIIATALFIPLTTTAAPVVKTLADDIYLFSENHYTSLIIVGDDGVLILDPSFTSHAESMKSTIAGITDKPVTHIILSHEHYDHVGGTEVFPGAEIICHRSCEAVFALDVMGVAPERVDVTFGDFMHLDFGGKTLHLHNYGPADGFASTVVFLPDERIAFTADLYEDGGLTNGLWMEDDNYLAILRTLKELKNKNLKHAVNSHSENTSVQMVEDNLAFVQDLYDLVLGEVQAAMQSGGPVAVIQSLERWQNELKLPKYANWGGYDEHLPVHIRRMVMSIFHGG